MGQAVSTIAQAIKASHPSFFDVYDAAASVASSSALRPSGGTFRFADGSALDLDLPYVEIRDTSCDFKSPI
jgi:hypothetical protein